jgi:PadR family transcriptional regulator, regulatory protein PadR
MRRNGDLRLPIGLEQQSPHPTDTGLVFPTPLLASFLLLCKRRYGNLLLGTKRTGGMKQRTDVKQGTLALMVLKTLDVLGSQHGYGIARRIEQISGDVLFVNQGTLYPVLLKLEQEGSIESSWGASENNRRARYYRLTKVGRKQLQSEVQDWQQTTEIMARFLAAKAEELS